MSLISGATNQTIDYIYSISRTKTGDKSRTLLYSNVPCRWEERTTIVKLPNNEEKTTKALAWLLPNYSVTENYEIVKDSETYTVVSVEKRYGLGGNHDHTRVALA